MVRPDLSLLRKSVQEACKVSEMPKVGDETFDDGLVTWIDRFNENKASSILDGSQSLTLPRLQGA